MKYKKFAAALAAILLCTVLCLPVSAEEWTGSDFTFTVPEELPHALDPTVSQDDPAWALAGIGNSAEMLKEYQEMGVVADFYGENGSDNIKVMSKSNSSTENIFTLKDMTEEDKQKFLDQLLQSQTEEITIEKSFVDVNGQPFYRVKTDGVMSETEIHELQYGTIFNGHTLTFVVYSKEGEIPRERVSLLETMVNSTRITKLLEKPEPEPLNMALLAVLLLVLVLVIAAPFVYVPLRNKRDKKQKAAMAQRISEYHKSGEKEPGGLRFVNETDCTQEAIHAFSRYHAYGKNIVPLLTGAGLCVVILALVFRFDATWWLKVLALGITVYYLYRVFSMPNTIEKNQRKVFGRGVSSTARYAFYENGFRVSGIQSASMYPYFQITSVHSRGHYLYLYYGADNAYLIDQFGFTQGSFEEFTAFIREKTAK